MAEPVDLQKMFESGGAVPAAIPPEFSRGVDLSIIRNKRKHQHRWAAIGHYSLGEGQVADIVGQMDSAMVEMKRQSEAGEEVIPLAPIPIPMEMNQLLKIDGPGCIKCNMHFSSPGGYGKLCERNDDDFGIVGSDDVIDVHEVDGDGDDGEDSNHV